MCKYIVYKYGQRVLTIKKLSTWSTVEQQVTAWEHLSIYNNAMNATEFVRDALCCISRDQKIPYVLTVISFEIQSYY